MGLLSFLKGTTPQAAATYDPANLNGSDKLVLFGSMLSDLANGEGPQQTMQARSYLMNQGLAQAKLAATRGLAGIIGGSPAPAPAAAGQTDMSGFDPGAISPTQAPAPAAAAAPSSARAMGAATPTPASTPPIPTAVHSPRLEDPAVRSWLARAASAGVDITPYVNLLKDSEPDMQIDPATGTAFDRHDEGLKGARFAHPTNINGWNIDQGDPSNIGKFFGEPPAKGAQPVFDQNGKHVGWNMMDGSLQAAQQTAAATSRGTAEGAAPYDFISTPTPSGAPQVRSKASAAAAGGVFTGQTPADAARDQAQGKGLGERAIAQPKAAATLSDADRTANFARDTIHNILGDTQDPKTGAWVPSKVDNLGGSGQVNRATTGAFGVTRDIPNTPAHDLKTKLDTILAQTAVSELQKMRDESPTGGALGRVTQQEIDMLAAMRGSLDQTQSPPQLLASLRHHLDQLDKIAATRDQLYKSTYPGGAAPAAASGPTPSQADLQAEARRRGLIK